mgnify:CR=1 FL=1
MPPSFGNKILSKSTTERAELTNQVLGTSIFNVNNKLGGRFSKLTNGPFCKLEKRRRKKKNFFLKKSKKKESNRRKETFHQD